jgi:hypothetical protein
VTIIQLQFITTTNAATARIASERMNLAMVILIYRWVGFRWAPA